MINTQVYPVYVTHNNGEIQLRYYDINYISHIQLFDMYSEMCGIHQFEIGDITII